MDSNIILYMMIGVGALFAIIVIAYFMLRKKMQSSDVVQIKQLRQGTKENKFSMEILYQKLYVFYIKTPFLKRYLFKVRRRLEIINIEDEYLTRGQASKIITNATLSRQYEKALENIKEQIVKAIGSKNIISSPSSIVPVPHTKAATTPAKANTMLRIPKGITRRSLNCILFKLSSSSSLS